MPAALIGGFQLPQRLMVEQVDSADTDQEATASSPTASPNKRVHR